MLGSAAAARADIGEVVHVALEGLEEFWLATDAYIYGYPLVTMEMTRRVMTNVAAPEGTRGADGPVRQAARSIPTRRSATSPRPTPTRSTRPPGSTSARSRGC